FDRASPRMAQALEHRAQLRHAVGQLHPVDIGRLRGQQRQRQQTQPYPECVAHACESARSFIEELRDVRSASRAIRRARLDVDPAWASVAFIVAVVLVLQYRIAAPGLHGRDTSVLVADMDAIGLAAIPGIGCGSRLGAERYV